MSDVPNPSIPTVADLFTPKQRVLIYLFSVLIAAAYPIIELNTELHWGFLAGWAAWNAFVGLVAVSNTPTTARRGNDAGYALWELCFIVVAVVLAILYIIHLVTEH
jgi:hypothetical protein